MTASTRVRLKRPTVIFLTASAVSGAGTGLVFPLSAIYLMRVRHLEVSVSASYFAVVALAGIAVSLFAGLAVDRLGAGALSSLGMLAEGAGLCVFAAADSPPKVMVAGGLIGAGSAVFFTALTPFLSGLEEGTALDRSFAVRSWLINAANAVGLASGGVVIAAIGDGGYSPLFLANGLTSLAFGLVLAFLRTSRSPAEGASSFGPMARGRSFDLPLVWLLVAHMLTVTFGFAMFETVVPVALVADSAATGAIANVMVLADVFVIVLAQMPFARWTRDAPRTHLLLSHCVCWGMAAAAALALSLMGVGPWPVAIAYGVFFGIGECLYAVGFRSLVAQAAPTSLQGRFNGTISLLYGVAFMIGPPLGLWTVDSGSPTALWLMITVAATCTAIIWSNLGSLDARRAPGELT